MKRSRAGILLFVCWMTVIPLVGSFFYRDAPKKGESYTDRVYLYDRNQERLLKLTPKEFIIGAIGVEMPANYDFDALVAQGIAAHTYLRYNRLCGVTLPMGADLEVDTEQRIGYTDKKHLKEAYGEGFSEAYRILEQAAEVAEEYLITHEGNPILAAYHAMSNGSTQGAEEVWQQKLPYLTAVESSFDSEANGYETIITLSAAEFSEAIRKKVPHAILTMPPDRWIREVKLNDQGYISTLEIGGVEIKGTLFREMICARSTDITAICTPSGQFVFTVRGYGHGVGLSQVGAGYLGASGQSYEEILMHYYPNTVLIATK